ncbi:AAA family ATPase [Kosakonia sp. H02]|nr:AAA family ATPase [Kosakonia sp. H02]
MLGEQLEIEGLIGVGRAQLALEPDQHIYTFIGPNGVGKTKMLEALFQFMFFNNELVKKSLIPMNQIFFKFKSFATNRPQPFKVQRENDASPLWVSARDYFPSLTSNTLPVVFLGAQARGKIDHKADMSNTSLGTLENRRTLYFLKLVQAIVSGYSYFTNETNIQKVKGIVFIDEIESHLHLSWQANIIPLLKKLFPNTTFYITTHSSIVLAQLKEGEAYNLYRDSDGIVKT